MLIKTNFTHQFLQSQKHRILQPFLWTVKSTHRLHHKWHNWGGFVARPCHVPCHLAGTKNTFIFWISRLAVVPVHFNSASTVDFEVSTGRGFNQSKWSSFSF